MNRRSTESLFLIRPRGRTHHRGTSPRSARASIAVLFLLNGAAFANWVPRIPAVKSQLALSDGQLGLAILGMGVGGLAASMLSGTLAERYGSRTVTLASCLLLCVALVLPGLAPGLGTLACALALVGASDAAMDVAMNAHGVTVQHRYGRSILNSLHGFWSLGAVLGGVTGSLAAALDYPVAWHLATTGLVLGLLTIAAAPGLLPSSADRHGARPQPRRRSWALPSRAVLLVGVLALLAAIVEDTPASWSAVYLREDLGASPGVAGLGFVAFTAAMTAGRLVGDRIVDRVGAARTTRVGAAIAALGLASALVISTPAAAITGFALLGLGMATVFPLAFSAAGHLPEQRSGKAIGMVALLARFGVLLEPPVIGGIADVLGLGVGLGLAVAAAMGVVALAGRLAPADRSVG